MSNVDRLEDNDIDKDLRVYEENKEELLNKHEGKFVLIKNEEIQGIFDTQQEAIDYGHETFGHVPLLVLKIVQLIKIVKLSTYKNMLN